MAEYGTHRQSSARKGDGEDTHDEYFPGVTFRDLDKTYVLMIGARGDRYEFTPRRRFTHLICTGVRQPTRGIRRSLDVIVVIRDWLTSSLCSRYVSIFSSVPRTTTPGGRRWWNDWVDQLCGANPYIRIYRYRNGQFFGQYYAKTNIVNIGSPRQLARPTWTPPLIYYRSGNGVHQRERRRIFLIQWPRTKKVERAEPLAIAPMVGMALLAAQAWRGLHASSGEACGSWRKVCDPKTSVRSW
ncbi:hypothetical protein NQZ79_g2739 [Umbelopsis isabellina]|nr:hypothetical protein NQZ79_g2739 [Umbelopsis isabellina]